MQDLMNNAPCGFVAFDDDGTLVEINQTLCHLLGYTPVELLGWHIDRILPPGGRIFYQTYIVPMLKVHHAVEEIYVALRSRDGNDLPVLMNAVRREREGRFLSDAVCMRMIRRHEYEEQLLQARKMAEESSAAKAKFLSMMSHDLRTPLTTISGNAELLALGEHGPLNERQIAAIDSIRHAARMQTALISDILEFARLDTRGIEVVPRELEIPALVERSEALLRMQILEAGLRLTITGCDDGITVMADPNRLQQILLNLLTNAIKYTPPGGEIELRCEAGGDRVMLHVRDTGVGIDPEDLARIFSPFVQVDVTGTAQTAGSRGVGLGLAISRELARAMNGDVTATSVPGKGSIFTIALPAATSRPAEPVQATQ